MSDSIFKKALGVFVDFDEQKQETAAVSEEPAAEAAPAQPLEPGADIAQDPDVIRVRQAIGLLADLPLEDIPVAKARKLIAGALQLAGLDAGDLADSFERARELHRRAVTTEQQQMAARQAVNEERLTLLEQAISDEKTQCAAELEERGLRIQQTTQALGEIEKAMAFFVTEEPKA